MRFANNCNIHKTSTVLVVETKSSRKQSIVVVLGFIHSQLPLHLDIYGGNYLIKVFLMVDRERTDEKKLLRQVDDAGATRY